jgi:hypothetical protein
VPRRAPESESHDGPEAEVSPGHSRPGPLTPRIEFARAWGRGDGPGPVRVAVAAKYDRSGRTPGPGEFPPPKIGNFDSSDVECTTLFYSLATRIRQEIKLSEHGVSRLAIFVLHFEPHFGRIDLYSHSFVELPFIFHSNSLFRLPYFDDIHRNLSLQIRIRFSLTDRNLFANSYLP